MGMAAGLYRALLKPLLPLGVRAAISRRVHSASAPEEPYKFSFAELPRLASPFPFIVDDGLNVLSQLGVKYLPSKRLHNYLPYYWLHFRDVRHSVRQVLEIGLETDHSIRMWEEFFPNARIYGIDLNSNCLAFEGGRRHVFIGDQGDPAFLREVVSRIGAPLDVVIDDGSHLVLHQLATFEHLFPTMSDHGIYVIEDTGGCVGDTTLRVVKAIKRLVDGIDYWPDGLPAERWPYLSTLPDEAPWAAKNIAGIAFYRWLVLVMRGRNPEDNPFLLRPDEVE